MKLRSLAMGAALAVATASSANAAIVLDFEGVANTFVLDFYNGGTDLFGNRGVNYGVSMGLNAGGMQGLIDTDNGGRANVANEPSGRTVMGVQLGGVSTMNIAAGFEDAFSVSYSSSRASFVRIYEGLNGQGRVLAELAVGAQHNRDCAGDPTGLYCNWTTAGVQFDGVARSVSFFGNEGEIFFDDVTLGAVAGGVPEPAAWALMIGGFGMSGAMLRRRRAFAAA